MALGLILTLLISHPSSIPEADFVEYNTITPRFEAPYKKTIWWKDGYIVDSMSEHDVPKPTENGQDFMYHGMIYHVKVYRYIESRTIYDIERIDAEINHGRIHRPLLFLKDGYFKHSYYCKSVK